MPIPDGITDQVSTVMLFVTLMAFPGILDCPSTYNALYWAQHPFRAGLCWPSLSQLSWDLSLTPSLWVHGLFLPSLPPS